jgi:hypothetical protein
LWKSRFTCNSSRLGLYDHLAEPTLDILKLCHLGVEFGRDVRMQALGMRGLMQVMLDDLLGLPSNPLRLKGVHKVRRRHADGKEVVYYYYRVTRQKLEGEPGTPEFLQCYAAAERAMRERSRGTLADLVRRFETAEFENMSETTRVEYKGRRKSPAGRFSPCHLFGCRRWDTHLPVGIMR